MLGRLGRLGWIVFGMAWASWLSAQELVTFGNLRGWVDPKTGSKLAEASSWFHTRPSGARKKRLLLSTGNMLGPAPSSHMDGGAFVLGWMDQQSFFASGLGENDFFLGLENLRQRLSQAKTPFLASNLSFPRLPGEDPQLETILAKKRKGTLAGRQVEVYSVLDPEALTKLGKLVEGVRAEDPIAALRRLREDEGEADLVVVLGTLSLDKGLDLLASLPWVDLLLLNQRPGEEHVRKGSFEHQLLDGRRILWAPIYGYYLGRVQWDPRSNDVSTRAISLEGRTPDPKVLSQAQDFVQRFEASDFVDSDTGERQLDSTERQDRGAFLLDSLRYGAQAEVSFLQEKIAEDRPMPEFRSRRGVRLIFPHPDRLALVRISGKTLQEIYRKSRARTMPERRLRFRGLEEVRGVLLVQGRRLSEHDTYRVATSEYLALGGYDYLPKSPQRIQDKTVIQAMQEFYDLGPRRRDRLRELERRSIHHRRASLDLSGARLAFGGDAAALQFKEPQTSFLGSDIPGLVGNEHQKYSLSLQFEHEVDRPESDLLFRWQAGYSKFRTTKTQDFLQGLIRWQDKNPFRKGPNFFASTDIRSTLRVPRVPTDPDVERPLFVRATVGLIHEPKEDLQLFYGLSRLARFSVPGDPGHTGLSLGADFQRKVRENLEFRGELDFFGSQDSARIRMLDARAEFRVKLLGPLSTVFRQRHFRFQDSTIGTAATRNETFLGFSVDHRLRRY